MDEGVARPMCVFVDSFQHWGKLFLLSPIQSYSCLFIDPMIYSYSKSIMIEIHTSKHLHWLLNGCVGLFLFYILFYICPPDAASYPMLILKCLPWSSCQFERKSWRKFSA